MSEYSVQSANRRAFLRQAGVAGAALAIPAAAHGEPHPAAGGHPEVSPLEDLMREHGLLERILLVYDEFRTRLETGREAPPDVIEEAAHIIRHFVEDYHERLEEDHLFPRFEKPGQLVPVVSTLRAQHKAGRAITNWIVAHASPAGFKTSEQRILLAGYMHEFSRMYRPHKAREDTVLFPAFHTLVTAKEYDDLGDVFENKEHELFGANGFEKTIASIAKLEERLEIGDLDHFTPLAVEVAS